MLGKPRAADVLFWRFCHGKTTSPKNIWVCLQNLLSKGKPKYNAVDLSADSRLYKVTFPCLIVSACVCVNQQDMDLDEKQFFSFRNRLGTQHPLVS